MFTVYVIKSKTHKFRYTGFTTNLRRRLRDHNNGKNKSTKHYRPFVLIYIENCSTRIEARTREKFLKSTRGREYLKDILSSKVPAPTKLV